MQKIEIKNFGPIKELKLDIKDFMLLIGPQASGKSTIAKTIFFFKSLNDDLVKFFMELLDKNESSNSPIRLFEKIVRQKFLDYFGSSVPLKGLSLHYVYANDIWITITLEERHSYITPKFSPELAKQINQLSKNSKEFKKELLSKNLSLFSSKDLLQKENSKQKFISELTKQCNKLFKEERELIFIPAGRSLLT